MRKFLLVFLLVFVIQLGYGQEVYRLKDGREAIFAGFYNTDYEKEMLYGKDIISVPDSLIDEQIEQLTYKELVDTIASRSCVLYFEGYEPFWGIELYKSHIKANFGENPAQSDDIEYIYTKNMGWGWSMTFRSKSLDLYGIIERGECDCSHDVNKSMVTCAVYFRGELHQGCAYWKKKEE